MDSYIFSLMVAAIFCYVCFCLGCFRIRLFFLFYCGGFCFKLCLLLSPMMLASAFSVTSLSLQLISAEMSWCPLFILFKVSLFIKILSLNMMDLAFLFFSITNVSASCYHLLFSLLRLNSFASAFPSTASFCLLFSSSSPMK